MPMHYGKKHEKTESKKEMVKEYGKKAAAKKMAAKGKKINPLDAAIMKKKPLKSKNKNPGRYLDK
jgi:hypothetical protein